MTYREITKIIKDALAKGEFPEEGCNEEFWEMIMLASAKEIETMPIKHGKEKRCGVCGARVDSKEWDTYLYCPICGQAVDLIVEEK